VTPRQCQGTDPSESRCLSSTASGLDLDANAIDGGASGAGQRIPDSRNLKAQPGAKDCRINPHRELLLTQGGRCDVVRKRSGQRCADIFLERNRGFRTAREMLQPGFPALDEFT
jgi:hypothetical protein